MFLFILFNILLIQSNLINSIRISCRDDSNQPVDWFVNYKLPRQTSNKNEFVSNGTAYIYMTDKLQSWQLSLKSLNDSSSNAASTLAVLYDNQTNGQIGYLMYNDQFGVGDDDNEESLTNARKAHAKGVLIFDNETAVWLIHSIPNYPPRPRAGKYKLALSQSVYGQSMLCLSFSTNELDKIGKQLLYAYPQVYDSFIPSYMLSQFNKSGILNNLKSVINGQRVNTAPWFNIATLTTLNNMKFLAFHKDKYFDLDLYANLIGPTIKSTLMTETWSRGVGTMSTNCSTEYPVYNIERINMNKLVPNAVFTVYSDHSKWAANLAFSPNETKYVCIGDINRQESQRKRGGGSVCFINNANVWSSYFNLIELTENCINENVAPTTL